MKLTNAHDISFGYIITKSFSTPPIRSTTKQKDIFSEKKILNNKVFEI
jgi:hypothetical protein